MADHLTRDANKEKINGIIYCAYMNDKVSLGVAHQTSDTFRSKHTNEVFMLDPLRGFLELYLF